MERNTVHVLELRRLLFELKDLRPDIHIRFRLMGEMWMDNYAAEIKLTETGAILNDQQTDLPFAIHSLNDVMQFELETKFQQYSPHFHYNVEPSNMHINQEQTA